MSRSANHGAVDAIVRAVLYEGYILYPYRPSATKNRHRFTFGRVYPAAYSAAQAGREPCAMQTQCLVEVAGPAPSVDVSIRFLHPIARDVGRLPEPLSTLPAGGEPEHEIVPEIEIGGHPYYSWQEAVEREVKAPRQALSALARDPVTVPFAFAASRTVEPVRDHRGDVAALFIRRQEPVEGRVELRAEHAGHGLFRMTVRILNRTSVPEGALNDAGAVLMRTLASTHTILHAGDGAFVSLMDPPPALRAAADACENTGTWPVLAGEPGTRRTVLSSPIVLYDYPEIAPESPGDLFDGTEVDEMLALRIMTLTDAEKREMRLADDRAREILRRTEVLPEEYLARLHGTLRGLRPAGDGASERLDEVHAGDAARLRAGRRVRIRPKGRADVMDLALAGRTAVVEAVEQDLDDRIHVAVVLDDDPGHDLGWMHRPGHRFFFAPDELEPL